MTTQLPERLSELADEAPGSLIAAGLWDEGRRRHRRRMVVVGAIVGAVLALTGVGYGDRDSRQPTPAAPPATQTGPMSVPAPLFNPSPWTPATRAPGRLVAVMSATRDRFPFGADPNAIAGVAAGSQTYRFLDLPGQSSQATDAYLSPDGVHLAYWVASGPGEARFAPGAVPGFAVLDLITGRVERHEVNSRFGLAPQSLSWADSSTLVLVADHFASSTPTSYAGPTRTYVFTLGQTSSYSSPPPGDVRDIPVDSTVGYAQMTSHRRLRFENPRSDAATPDITLSTPAKSVAYDVGRGWVATTEGNVDASGPTSGALMVGRVVGHHAALSPVPGNRRYAQVVTWVDPTHVATVRQNRNGLVYDVVDIRTGERRQLTSKPWYGFSLALDAVRGATTVPGIEPPRPWNPRVLAVGGLAVVICLGGVVLVVRRRRVRA